LGHARAAAVISYGFNITAIHRAEHGRRGACHARPTRARWNCCYQAGCTPAAALHIANHNGARYLGRAAQIGTLAVGKHADLVLVKGTPAQRIEDSENAVEVLRDGIAYDALKLTASVRGQAGGR